LAIRPDLPIILCSGSSPETNSALTAEKSREIGIREVLLKPVDKQQLNRAICRQFNSQPNRAERGEHGEYSYH
jgi:two-component SAPR family response regulator